MGRIAPPPVPPTSADLVLDVPHERPQARVSAPVWVALHLALQELFLLRVLVQLEEEDSFLRLLWEDHVAEPFKHKHRSEQVAGTEVVQDRHTLGHELLLLLLSPRSQILQDLQQQGFCIFDLLGALDDEAAEAEVAVEHDAHEVALVGLLDGVNGKEGLEQL